MTTEVQDKYVPTKDIDLDLLIYLERYATNLLKWDLLLFFGQHPDESRTAQEIARHLGLSFRAIRPELGDLAMLGVLNKFNRDGKPVYQLTTSTSLRDLTLKFAKQIPSATSSDKSWLYPP